MHEIELGKNKRMSFSRIPEKLELPNLIEVQKDSYEWFVRDGLREVFRDVSPITDYTGNLILEFLDYSLKEDPKYSIAECKERDATYAVPLRVKIRLINKETGEYLNNLLLSPNINNPYLLYGSQLSFINP